MGATATADYCIRFRSGYFQILPSYLIGRQVQLQQGPEAAEGVVSEDGDGVVGEVERPEVVAGLGEVG